jgi:hypothetical protein
MVSKNARCLHKISRKFRRHASIQEEFEDANMVIRIRKSENRQPNGLKKKYKRTNNDLQNIHIKLKTE